MGLKDFIWSFFDEEYIINKGYCIELDYSMMIENYDELSESYEELADTLKLKEDIIEILEDELNSIAEDEALEEEWNNKRPKTAWRYPGRLDVLDETKRMAVDPRIFFQKDDIIPHGKGDYDLIANDCLKWVNKNITYTSDSKGGGEYWQFAYETFARKKGDCIAEYEEIYTKDGIKSAKDIEVGDEVLSYDLTNGGFIYKPIVNKWDKGKLPIKRVHFRNGQHIDITDNHHMAVRTNQKYSSYEKLDLKDVDLTRWWKRKVPIAKKIPYNKSEIYMWEDLYVVIGHFLAEGSVSKSHVSSSGYELIEDIIPILEKRDIPFTEYENNFGVPCIRFLKSDFKDYLKKLKTNSFDIHLTEEIFHLPETHLESLLYGMWLGDGTKNQYEDKRGYRNNKEWTYSTSSKQLASDIQRIGLQLGRSFHIWEQKDHKGVGNKPIYRINYNTESHFLKDYGYEDISEVSISYVEDLGEYQTYDWEVKDTHTFVFKNGIITFQCEDGAILMANMMLMSGIPYWRIRLNAGSVQGGGHCYLTYLREEDNQWYVMDWCFVDNRRTTVSTVNGKKRFKDLRVGDEVISFNEKTKKVETSKINKVGSRKVNKTFRIKYLNATGKVEYVECSEEHPFYVDGKWIRADELKINQEIYAIQPRALYALCGNHTKTKEWINKITQSNIKNGTYERTSDRQTKNNVFTREDVKLKLSNNNCMKNPDIVEKVFSKRLKKSYKSQPEIKFINKLSDLNLPVRFVGDGSFWVKGKNPDFKVEGEKKVIEVTQYGYLGRDEKWARERTKHFVDNGFKCLIVFYEKGKKESMVCDEDLLSFVMNGFKITSIKELNKNKTVWNIHCESNNNYFVNGMLVHNCYWPNESIDFKKPWKNAEKYFGIWGSWNSEFVFGDLPKE